MSTLKDVGAKAGNAAWDVASVQRLEELDVTLLPDNCISFRLYLSTFTYLAS